MDAILRPQTVMLSRDLIEFQSKWLYQRLLGKKYTLVLTVEGHPLDTQVFEDQQVSPQDTVGTFQQKIQPDALKFCLPVEKQGRLYSYISFPLNADSEPFMTLYRDKIVYSFMDHGCRINWIIIVKD